VANGGVPICRSRIVRESDAFLLYIGETTVVEEQDFVELKK
jgi:hypothetical protein